MTVITPDPKFVDVDFPCEDRFIYGWQAETELLRDSSSDLCYSDVVEVYPESEWKDRIKTIEEQEAGIELLVTRVYNQSNEGSCVANACAQAHEINQARQWGKERVTHLSAMSLYQLIGRSAQSGAMIFDGLEEGTDYGILPLDSPENRKLFGNVVMPNTGFRTKRPEGTEATAAQFQFGERYIIRSLAELITAGINGDPVVVGRAGHSICYLRPTYTNSGMLMYMYVNSWLNWGQPFAGLSHGLGFDSGRNLRNAASSCFAIRTVKEPDHLVIEAPLATAL